MCPFYEYYRIFVSEEKDEELNVKHVLQGGEAELFKDRARARPRWQTEEAADSALR